MNSTVRLAAILLALTTGCSMMAQQPRAQSPAAESLRMSICLNGAWETVDVESDAAAPAPNDAKPAPALRGAKAIPASTATLLPAEGWTGVRVPAGPLANTGRPSGVWYRRTLDVPKEWNAPERRFLLEIEKVGHYAAIFCNGRKMGEHFDQFTPFEADVTDALEFGKPNRIAVFVHSAAGVFARPGGALADDAAGMAYRPAGQSPTRRDWVGIVGDVTLSWRPAQGLGDVTIVPSFRKKSLEVRADAPEPKVAGVGAIAAQTGEPVWTIRAAVLDGDKEVLTLPEAATATGKTATLQAKWETFVPWNPPHLGTPKLYFLRTELVRDGKVVDRTWTRFGFREVWADGKQLMLNGQRLFVVGNYHIWLDPMRYNNDRRAIALDFQAMQAAGVNSFHGHWDALGQTVLDVADEMGILVVDGLYCDGQLSIKPTADEQWQAWALGVTQEWAHGDRNHPSIVMWRPFCATPAGLQDMPAWTRQVTDAVHKAAPGALVCGSEIATHGQGPMAGDTQEPDDASRMVQRAAGASQPLLTNEIWASFDPYDAHAKFFETFYRKAWDTGTAGFIVQHLPYARTDAFEAAWPSDSGEGGRTTDPSLRRFVNWSDAAKPASALANYGELFAGLTQTVTGSAPKPFAGTSVGQVMVNGAAPGSPVFLVPADAARGTATAVVPAADGTAWFVVRQPGEYRAVQGAAAMPVTVAPQKTAAGPGFEYLQKVDLAGK